MEKGEIKDFVLYNKLMQSGIQDKIFFLENLENCDILVDYGCADVFLISTLLKLRPDIKYVGYDIDIDMILSAKANNTNDNVVYTNDWNDVLYELMKYDSPGILLSSVIHEVISYGTSEDYDIFISNVFSGDFSHIFIRDMMVKKSITKLGVSESDYNKIVNSEYSSLLDSFENKWGSCKDNYLNFVHFLHKYKYAHNWETENNENYFPIFLGDFLYRIPETFFIEKLDTYKYDYTSNLIKTDFDIDLEEDVTTHVKMIIRKG